MNYKKQLTDFASLFLLHSSILLIAYHFLLLCMQGISPYPWNNPEKLMMWDAGWYYSITENGYVFNENGQSNPAFFPLFPYLWRWVGGNAHIVSLVNYIAFWIGLYVLADTFEKRKWSEILPIMVFPSLFFVYVPYSEALFYMFAAILLRGLVKENLAILLIGLVGICFTRSVTMLLIPAFLLIWIYNTGFARKIDIKRTILYGVALMSTLACMYIVLYIQYAQTGVWGAFFKSQYFWHPKFHLPILPFRVWGVERTFHIEALAACLGAFAVGFIFHRAYVFLFKNEQKTISSKDNALFFSELYLAAMLTIALTYNSPQTMSVHRYILATPFATVVLWEYWNRLTYARREQIIFFVVISLMFLCMDMREEIRILQDWFFFAFIYLYLYAHYYMGTKSVYRERIWVAFYLIGVALQVKLLSAWLLGEWTN